MKIREHGIQTREKLRAYAERPQCSSDGKNFGSVRWIDCYSALVILGYGFLISLLIFVAEITLQLKLRKICSKNIINAAKNCCSGDKTVYNLGSSGHI